MPKIDLIAEEITSKFSDPTADRATALQRLISELLRFKPDDRRNVIETLATFFGLSLPKSESSGMVATPNPVPSTQRSTFQFSEEPQAPSPKAFMFSKSPKTDVERVACLAYYLAHYRGTPHLKTKDITTLNTESAHKPFSNTAVAVENAAKMGYLVPSLKGSKQLSASGERFVETLPDREAAKEIFEQSRHRRSAGAGKKSEKA